MDGRSRRGLVGAALVLTIGSSIAASPSPAPADSPGPDLVVASSDPSAPPAASPSPVASRSPVVQPGSRHSDTDLEALLPQTLGGVSLTIESQLGTELSASGSAFETFLGNLGRQLEDFSLASAYSMGGDLRAQVGAWRVRGAPSEALLTEYIGAVRASSAVPLTVAPVMVAGQEVTQVGVPGELAQGPLYVYVLDDTLLFVQTPDPTLAEEAIEKLP